LRPFFIAAAPDRRLPFRLQRELRVSPIAKTARGITDCYTQLYCPHKNNSPTKGHQTPQAASQTTEGETMFETKRKPRLLIPGLQGFYDAVTPLSWPLVRCAVGLILAVHGWGKVSKGAEAFVPVFAKMGLEPAALVYWTLLVVEFVGGICLAAGLFTRVWAAAITIEMLVIVNIYIPNGFAWLNRGYEFALLWAGVALAIWIKGGGEYSLDRKLGVEL
jgi:putative oxidoreductase